MVTSTNFNTMYRSLLVLGSHRWTVMAGSETSFNSYTFTYNWKVNDLKTRLHNPIKLSSPTFSSPSGVKPATKWMLTIFNGDRMQAPPILVGQQYLSAELTRLACCAKATPLLGATSSAGGVLQIGSAAPVQQLGFGIGGLRLGPPPTLSNTPELQKQKDDDDEDVWVEANLTPSILTRSMAGVEVCTRTFQEPTKLRLYKPKPAGILPLQDTGGTNVITFNRFLRMSKINGSKSVSFSCQIKVWSLDKPIHVANELLPSPDTTNADKLSDFSLSRFMEEARQNSLFTDVTLVADGKEFKAHKVVLASQSQFYKTRFSSRWTDPRTIGYTGDRVEMTDVPAVIMEAILSYMYTGKVANVGKIAYQLLPVAEEYGLVGLREMCEEALIKSLTSNTVISMLIHAAAHNAPDLKKACMEFIVSNTASVRQSEWWGKLKETQAYRDLWMELLENIAEKHSTANTTGMSIHPNQTQTFGVVPKKINPPLFQF